jgi:ubiquinone/menaquinone biosynthesis C-methylase UbiE
LTLNAAFRGRGSSADLARATEYLDALSAHPAVRAYKARTFDLTLSGAPRSVLDVGCGLGDDVVALGERSSTSTRVVGTDISPVFLAEARRRAPADGGVEFVEANTDGSLPFPDGSFDAVRADRVLQHLDKPGVLLDEMRRVISSGGRIVLSEPDWGELSIADLDDEAVALTRELVSAAFSSPTVGRGLAAELEARGFGEVAAERTTLAITSLQEAQLLLSFDELLAAAADSDTAARMLSELSRLEQAEKLEIEIVGYIASGLVPGRG